MLEVGSANVNGGNRHHFTGPYTGIDVVAGEGVDLVVQDDQIPFDSGMFGVVLSTECFEHARAFWVTASEMMRVCADDGVILVTMRGNGFPQHNTPDRWRCMPDALTELFTDLGLVHIEETDDPQVSGRFLIGHKR